MIHASTAASGQLLCEFAYSSRFNTRDICASSRFKRFFICQQRIHKQRLECNRLTANPNDESSRAPTDGDVSTLTGAAAAAAASATDDRRRSDAYVHVCLRRAQYEHTGCSPGHFVFLRLQVSSKSMH